MEELLKYQEKYNITEKDLFILSKLESGKRKNSFLDNEKRNARMQSVLKKYEVSLLDKISILTKLKKSNYHENSELIEKYSGSENSDELKEADKKGTQKFIMVIVVFIVVFLGISMASKKTNNYKSNSDSATDVSSNNGTYSYSDNSAQLNVTVNGNMWSLQATIKSGFGDSYDNSNSQYDSGIVKGNDLYDKSGMVRIGYVNGSSLTTSFSGHQVTLRKN